MLKPRETDLPALFVVLVVLPIIAYIILGKWNDASKKKKVKITMLAHIAAEEAFRAESMVIADVFPALPVAPSLKGVAHLCARCFAPATTRCSRCKSVRYCSGKCQILHWRQGHKQDCQLPLAVLYNFTDKRIFVDGARELTGNDAEKHLHGPTFSDFSVEPFCQKTDISPNAFKPGHEKSMSVDYEKTTNESKRLIKQNNVEKKFAFNMVSHEDRSLPSAEEKVLKGDIMYKKPPYTLDSQKSLPRTPNQPQSQASKRKGEAETDSRPPQHATTTASVRSCEGLSNSEETMIPETSRKSSKSTKRGLSGLMSSYRKMKALFPYEDLVKLFQCEVTGIVPRGLLNCGNSCYANVVLQCLTFTKPLMVYLLRRSHSRTCRTKKWCLMCELEQHATMLLDGGGPLSPSNILVNMRSVGCRMGGGNQEDAHEFLRLLVMSMQAVFLEDQGGEKKVDPGLQETTLVQQIFGGRLKSKVKCLRCHHESERYENIMDLTLEIFGWVESLEDALTQFTTPEDLDGENMYRCGRCSTYVKARKQLSLHEVPNILTIVLKRFQTGKFGKINKCVTFPDLLDMIPFVTGSADSPPLYTLYAVIVHLDTLNTSFSGHYVSYVKDIHGTWFRIDDSEVQVVPSSQVMSEGAYMLFYSRCFPRPPRACIEKSPLRASPHQHESRHGQDNEVVANSKHEKRREGRNANAGIFFRSDEMHVEPAGIDFSDVTSSEWSLFTSSDDSSFTTESTRDSFSAIDHGDSTGLDTISSIFGPFYLPGSSQGNAISCTKSSSSGPQTRFYAEKREFVSDSSAPTRLAWRCT